MRTSRSRHQTIPSAFHGTPRMGHACADRSIVLTRSEFAAEPAIAVEGSASLASEQHCAAMLAQDPGNRDAISRLSVVLLQRGAFAEAAAPLRRFLEVDPDFADAHNNLGIAMQG